MATLTGTTIQSTYDSLLKVTDNDSITGSLKRITDGLGNNTPLYLSSSAVEIVSALNVIGNITGTNLSGTNTGDETKGSIESKLGAATSSNSGYLTSTDWSTFNNKIAGSGTLNKLAKFSSSSSIADSTITDTGSAVTIGVATTVSGNLTATSLIKSGGTASQILAADGSVITAGTNITISGGTISSSGGISGSGTTNTIPKFTGASAIGNSNITDTGSLITLGSGTNIVGGLAIGTTPSVGYNLHITRALTGSTVPYGIRSRGLIQSDVTSHAAYYDSTSETQAATFTLTNLTHYRTQQGTFGAGSTVTNQHGFLAGGLTGATNNFGFRGQLVAATGAWNIYMDGTANNYLAGALGIGATTLTGYNVRIGKSLTGSTSMRGIYQESVVQSDVTALAAYNTTYAGTAAASFTLSNLYHNDAVQGTFGAGSVITNQIGYRVDSSLIGATNNYGFFGNIASGTGRWNLFMSGTANNYINGALGISTQTLTGFNINIARNLTGAVTARGIQQAYTIQSDVTNAAIIYSSGVSTAAATFTLPQLTHYFAGQGVIGAGSTVTDQHGFRVESTLIGATNNYGFRGQIASGTGRWNIYMDGTANNHLAGALGIGSTSLATTSLRISRNGTGGTQFLAIDNQTVFQSDVTVAGIGYNTFIGTQATAFTLAEISHFRATQGTIGAGSTVTTQVGFNVGSGLIGGTNNYGFRGSIPSGTGRFNLYMDGTADNYIAGKLGVGSTILDAKVTIDTLAGYGLDIYRSDLAANYYSIRFRNTTNSATYGSLGFDSGGLRLDGNAGIMYFSTSNTERMRLTSAGNLGIGTTAPAYKLQVGDGTGTGSQYVRVFSAAADIYIGQSGGTLFGFTTGTAGFIANDKALPFAIGTTLTQPLVFGTSNTERMRIFSGGNIAIGSTTDNNTGAKLQVTGNISFQNIFNRRTASYTLAITDQNDIVEMNVGTANNLTIPPNSSVAFPIGTEIAIIQYGAGQTTIVAGAGVTLRSKSNALKISGQYAGCTCVKVGTDEWYVIGDLTI